MTNEKNYLIKLTPLGPFFFGGRKRSEAETETDYYLKSRYFPQQTAVLGMLRHELLMQNEIFPLNKENRTQAAQLIGACSFDPDKPRQEFGVIRELSPLFLIHEAVETGEKKTFHYHIAPRDHGLVLEENGKNLCFKNYKPKEHTPVRLLAKESPDKPLEMDEFFIEHEQVGIRKSETGQSAEDAYYKQVFYRLIAGVSFAFFLRLSNRWDNNARETLLESNKIFMGGERSAFKLEVIDRERYQDAASVQPLYDHTLPEFPSPRRYARIVLTADAFVESVLLEQCRLAVCGSVFFRNIRSHMDKTRKFNNLSQSDDGGNIERISPYLGGQYNLLARGSVLYCEDTNAPDIYNAVELKNDAPIFRKTGYNYYKYIKPTDPAGEIKGEK
jgi:CRISPR-associated protein Cmr3